MQNDELIKVETLKGGAIIESVNEAIQKCLDNIIDPNSEPEGKRVVTLKIALKPTIDRATMEILTNVKADLAPDIAITTMAYVGKKDGKGFAAEVRPRQREIPGTEGQSPAGTAPQTDGGEDDSNVRRFTPGDGGESRNGTTDQ